MLLELYVLAPPVLKHGLPQQLVEGAVVEDRQLGHDLGGGGGPGQANQGATRQGPDLISVSQRSLEKMVSTFQDGPIIFAIHSILSNIVKTVRATDITVANCEDDWDVLYG